MLVCAAPCDMLPSFFLFLDTRHSHMVVRPLRKVDAAAESAVADQSSAIVATGSAAAYLLQVRVLCVCVCVYVVQWGSARLSPLALLPLHFRAQPADGGPADEAAVRAVFFAHYERGAPADYVQLKDVAVALKALDPACHQRLCYKVGTQVTCNEALAAVLSRVVGVEVRNVQVTLPGQVKVRGPVRGFRKLQADSQERASKSPRLDPAVELEALRERVRALQLENERLQEAAAAAELRAGAAELRAVAAEARAAAVAMEPPCAQVEPAACAATEAARPDATSPLPASNMCSSGESEGGDSCNSAAPPGAPSTLAVAHSFVRETVRFQRTGIEAVVEAYDPIDGLHTVSANGRTWREALVGRSAVGFVRVAPEGAIRCAEPRSELSALVASLEAGLLALGHWDAFPAAGETWRAVPLGMDLEQWTRVLDVGMRPGGLAILLVTGTLVQARLHTAVLRLIAERLPGSSVIALNVGELEADAEAYDALASAVAQQSCVLGHLYFRDPVSEAEHDRKRCVRAQLRRNCAKPGYLAQLARDEVWALRGAHCWHNFSDALRSRALVWAKARRSPASATSPALPPPSRPTLRAPRPLHGTAACIGIGRAHQAEVQAWPHGDSPTAPQAAAATSSFDRGDARVAIHEADVLRKQRAGFNARVLTAEPRRRWPDAGAQRFALGPKSARKLLAYVCDPANRDARGRLRLDDAEGTMLGGYGNYRVTHTVEAGAHHSEAEQVRHTLLLSRDVLDLARDALPGLDALVEGALRQLPEAEADGHALVPLHGHILDQGSGTARFADHQDTEEEVAVGARAPDRRVVYTVVIALSDGGDTAMRILGQDELAFTGEAGSGVAFRSALWHRTERASAGVWKLALFYGYQL